MNTLFAYPSFDTIASDLSKAKNWTHGKIQFNSFEQDWPDIFIENVHTNIYGKKVYYIADITHSKDLFPNIAVIQALSRYFSEKLEVIIPFFPVGTMERISQE